MANAAVGKSWAGHATGILTGLAAGGTFLLGALDLAGAPVLAPSSLSDQARLAVDAGTMVTGFAGAAMTALPVRRWIARFVPIDPESPVHALAMTLAVILFGTQVSSIAFTDVLAANTTQPPLTVADLVLNEVPFLILALAGVGLFGRRNASDAARRLGLVRPAWWHVVLALACAGAFFAFGQGMGVLGHALTPAIANRVDATAQHVFGGLSGPAGILVLALAPGICEETLFRGALQPRIGILASALLFASIHTEYGLSFDTLSVFVIAIGLGLLRKTTNTTTSSICHVTYNLLVGISATTAMLWAGGAVEIVLACVAGYAILAVRRRQAAGPTS